MARSQGYGIEKFQPVPWFGLLFESIEASGAGLKPGGGGLLKPGGGVEAEMKPGQVLEYARIMFRRLK